MGPHKPLGIVFFCEDSGIITDVVNDDFGIITGPGKGVGKLFQNIIDVASREKAFEFLIGVKSNKVAFDYQMNLLIDQEIKTLYFIGIMAAGKVLVIGANNHKDVVSFTNQMQEIGNEQATLIRSLVKSQYQPQMKDPDTSIYDEITQLNNELVNLQRELTLKNIELQKLNELKNKFLGMAAHDLRNPISVIMGYSDFLSADLRGIINPDQVKILDTMYKSSIFMLHLLEDLLDIAAIESGHLNLNLQHTDIVDVIQINADLNRVIGARKNISIQVETSGAIPPVSIDASKMEQVMNNLISNAIKFSMPGTLVRINISASRDVVTVSVADQGQGIPADELHKLFKTFERTTVRATAGEKSTGLGLSIARNIVLGHGGKIWVESEPGTGSTFYFTIPYTPSSSLADLRVNSQ